MTVTDRMPAAGTQLPRGPNGLPRGRVLEIQRGRILAAAVDVIEEIGYAGLTVGKILGRARVSRKTFYDVFADREDCFLGAFEHTSAQARRLASDAYAREGDWRGGTRAALGRLLGLMDEEPGLARLWVVESLGAGERVLERRAQVLDDLAKVIDEGRDVSGDGCGPPDLTAEGVVGGVVAVLYTRLLRDAAEPLADLLGPLMYMIVSPYFGAAEASQELDGPAREAPRQRPPRRSVGRKDPLEGLELRLTYRTVRVLTVVAEHPGASNRKVAEGSGIVDQGQISKLLSRLARLDLIENRSEGWPSGGSNAWQLTRRGGQIVRATRPR